VALVEAAALVEGERVRGDDLSLEQVPAERDGLLQKAPSLT
jgi:hypothetical protein